MSNFNEQNTVADWSLYDNHNAKMRGDDYEDNINELCGDLSPLGLMCGEIENGEVEVTDITNAEIFHLFKCHIQNKAGNHNGVFNSQTDTTMVKCWMADDDKIIVKSYYKSSVGDNEWRVDVSYEVTPQHIMDKHGNTETDGDFRYDDSGATLRERAMWLCY